LPRYAPKGGVEVRRGRGGGERREKGKGAREGRKGMVGPIPNPLIRVCY